MAIFTETMDFGDQVVVVPKPRQTMNTSVVNVKKLKNEPKESVANSCNTNTCKVSSYPWFSETYVANINSSDYVAV